MAKKPKIKPEDTPSWAEKILTREKLPLTALARKKPYWRRVQHLGRGSAPLIAEEKCWSPEVQYRCHADDEDLTARVEEKVQAIISSSGGDENPPWRVEVVCSQGHKSIFEGGRRVDLTGAKVPSTKVPKVGVDLDISTSAGAAASFSSHSLGK